MAGNYHGSPHPMIRRLKGQAIVVDAGSALAQFLSGRKYSIVLGVVLISPQTGSIGKPALPCISTIALAEMDATLQLLIVMAFSIGQDCCLW